MLRRIILKTYKTLIVISMALFAAIALINSDVFAGDSQLLDKVVAIVNEDVITESELDIQMELIRKQLIARGVALPAEDVLRKQVLQHLIDMDIQLQLAKTYGVTVDSTELDTAINKVAADNKLTLTKLREELINQGMDWETYRDNFRKEMVYPYLLQHLIDMDIPFLF